MNAYPHGEPRISISGDAMQHRLRAGRVERSRHLAAITAEMAGGVRAFFRSLFGTAASGPRAGDLSGRPA